MTRKTKVLLVEDSVADATLILEIFEDQHIDVEIIVARDGIEALHCLNKTEKFENASTPDIIILDLNMPRMDGRELLAKIKGTPAWDTIPVLVLTTSKAEEDIVTTYKLGANCFITKPIELDQFVKIVESINKFWFTAVQFTPRH